MTDESETLEQFQRRLLLARLHADLQAYGRARILRETRLGDLLQSWTWFAREAWALLLPMIEQFGVMLSQLRWLRPFLQQDPPQRLRLPRRSSRHWRSR